MKKTVPALCSLAFCFWIFAPPTTAFAANSAKVGIGAGLIVGGVVLGIQGVNDAICFGGDCGHGGEVEFFAGVAMIGVGTFILIKGLREHGSSASERQKRMDALIARSCSALVRSRKAGPARSGFGGKN